MTEGNSRIEELEIWSWRGSMSYLYSCRDGYWLPYQVFYVIQMSIVVYFEVAGRKAVTETEVSPSENVFDASPRSGTSPLSVPVV